MIVYGKHFEWAVMDTDRKLVIAVFSSEIAASLFLGEICKAFPQSYTKITLNKFEALYCNPKRHKQTA